MVRFILAGGSCPALTAGLGMDGAGTQYKSSCYQQAAIPGLLHAGPRGYNTNYRYVQPGIISEERYCPVADSAPRAWFANYWIPECLAVAPARYAYAIYNA